ncbi:MAG: carbohydrate ABC transporter permease [Acidimicrobiales bacterium]
MATTIFTGRDDPHLDEGSRSWKEGAAARRESRAGLLFVSPWIIGLTLFSLFPLIASLAMSFTSYRLVGDDPVRFVGFDNWQRVLTDPEVRKGAAVTFRFAAIFIPMSLLVPLGFAYLLTAKHLWGRSVFRVLFYLPTMVPFIAGVIVWRFYLNAQTGWLARLLGAVGISSPDWLNDPTYIIPSLGLIATWGVGNAMIIFIAALNSVPKDLYEAATLEGAGSWQLFRDITWPLISPITFYNLVIAFIALGQYFVVPFALTEGGFRNPGDAASFYTIYFYRQTFTFFQAGYGTALAWAMFIVVSMLTAVLFWSARYWVHYEFEERR